MNKNFIRELFIMVLLALVIIITLRIVLFDFIPNKNSLPKPIEYTMDSVVEDVLKEISLEETNNKDEYSRTETLLKSYTIEKSDLKNYVSKRHDAGGRIDPFTNENNT